MHTPIKMAIDHSLFSHINEVHCFVKRKDVTR